MIETKNAIIESAYFDNERGLSAWIGLDYGDSCHQAFGGYMLYAPKFWKTHESNYAGHFIYRCLEIAGVSDWSKMIGKTVRVKAEHDKVHAIGHIVKDDWFWPSVDFFNAAGPEANQRLGRVEPARAPAAPLRDYPSDLLDEIEEFLGDYQKDIPRIDGDGMRPNTPKRLLAELKEARR